MPEFIVEQETSPPFLNATLRSRVLLLLALWVDMASWHLVIQSGLPTLGRELGFGVEVGRGVLGADIMF